MHQIVGTGEGHPGGGGLGNVAFSATATASATIGLEWGHALPWNPGLCCKEMRAIEMQIT